MAITKLSRHKYLLDFYPHGRNGKRVRRTFPTSWQAHHYEKAFKERKFLEEITGEPQPVRIPLSMFTDKYLNYVSNTHAKPTWEGYENTFRQLNAYFKKTDPDLITIRPDEIISFIIHIQNHRRTRNGKPLSVRTINRYKENLRSSFNVAIKWGYLKRNPARSLTTERLEEKLPRIVSYDEFARLLKVSALYLQNILILTYFAGLRKQEIFRLRFSDLDFKTKSILIREAKNKKDRILPMHQEIFNKLSRQNTKKKQNAPVVSFNGSPIRSNVKRSLLRACIDVGLPFVTLHNFRHSFAVNSLRAGIPIRTVQTWLDHASISTTMRYLSFTDKMIQEDISKLPSLQKGLTTK